MDEFLSTLAAEKTFSRRTPSDCLEPEGLSVLRDSLNSDGHLHKAGIIRSTNELERLNRNRTTFEHQWKINPGIASEQLQPPVIICGHGRSGTSALQQLLNSTDEFNTISLSKSLYLYGDAASQHTSDGEPKKATQWIEKLHEEVPALKHSHPQTPSGPDEDTFVIEQTFNSPSFRCWAPISDYMKWHAKQSLVPSLHYLEKQLKHLQFKGQASPHKPWLLKCPFYFGRESEVLEVFPNATLIFTHRDPAETLPSLHNLLRELYKLYSHASPSFTEVVAESMLSTASHLSWRDSSPRIDVIDIDFDALMHNPVKVGTDTLDAISKCNSSFGDAKERLEKPSDLRSPSTRENLSHSLIKKYNVKALFKDYIELIKDLKEEGAFRVKLNSIP